MCLLLQDLVQCLLQFITVCVLLFCSTHLCYAVPVASVFITLYSLRKRASAKNRGKAVT
jgi:hypothetical protein